MKCLLPHALLRSRQGQEDTSALGTYRGKLGGRRLGCADDLGRRHHEGTGLRGHQAKQGKAHTEHAS